ncbi:hypothetical protein GCM10010329_27360 [Streptomyces spiroverticillatus]|uniref:Uncharacterized protein n=1 Tax=Streptomyces finlayi TaxID=67296 RepID=A0A918WVL6_9ACTN|nr:DUF6099 family protein [Streptomyces finlayi]GHA03523.1 hypothetical protein GCM10010329_27360 [Streptomyces spiroverticillatus]GHC87690.1 hypothetical protein GCM10010334_19770 [Streptomyces finlayi]
MDAVRLVRVSRHALAQSQASLEILTEAWQAQALTQAIGGMLAVKGPPELRGEAQGLSEAGGRGCGTIDWPTLSTGGQERSGLGVGQPPDPGPRAARLTEVPDARGALDELGGLLGEVGIALVGVACAADEGGFYWQTIEAIDAADESNDRVRGLLRRLTVWENGRLQGAAHDSAAGPS